MENLINFDENDRQNESPKKQQNNPGLIHPLLVNDRMSLELNNPFDKLEYRATHLEDPFECLEKNQMTISQQKAEAKMENGEKVDSQENEDASVPDNKAQKERANSSLMSVASSNGSKNPVVRCQSDSSTVSSHEGGLSRFNSLDNVVTKKSNQLLKLSLLNSPNSPLHSSSFNNSSAEAFYLEAKKISEKFKDFNDISFEDLNNISQHLIDTSNISINDIDLEQLRISFLDKNSPSLTHDSPETTEIKESMQGKIESLQERLKLIKQEEEIKPKVEKKEPVSPKLEKKEVEEKSPDQEMDGILQKFKSLMKNNNRDEARKQLAMLNDMLSPTSDSDSHLQAAQPYIRQDTFEIDQTTGNRRYSNGGGKDESNTSNNELMEQLAKLLGAQSLDVSALNLSGSNNNVVVIVPKMPSPISTPVKSNNVARRSVSFSAQRPSNSIMRGGIENRKLSTPMKPTTTSMTANSARRSSFAAPRSVTKPSNLHESKINMGAVRKSLMGSMDKSPMKAKSPPLKKNIPPPRSTTVRRSVSLKTTLPSVTVSQPTPKKSQITPPGATPLKNRAPAATRPPSTPTACRRASSVNITRPPASAAAANQRQSVSANQKRPVTSASTQKTEFRTPYGKTTVSKLSTNAKGSLV